MANGTVFYKACKAGGLISLRASIYGKEDYSATITKTDAFAWLYKKIAYATASAGGSAIGTNKGSGIGTTPGVSLYSKGAEYNAGPRFIPKPHLVSLKTSYDGDYGMVIKCEIAFTVYTLAQLNSCAGFFKIGADCYANWGWAGAGKAGSSDSFKGQVVNFSWAINTDGGADCTCTALGKGINIMAINKNVNAGEAGSTEAGEDAIPVTGVMSLIASKVQAAKDLAINTIDPASEIACIEYSEDWASEVKEEATDPPTEKPEEETETLPKQYYISLKKIVYYYNGAIKLAWKAGKAPVVSIEKATADLTQFTGMASANPTECLFPGFATYGEKDFNIAGLKIDGDGNLGNILFNVDWMIKQYKDFSTKVDKGEKTSDQSIDGFFKILFANVEVNSGGAIKLTAAKSSENENNIDIIDAAYVPDLVPITTIPAVSQNSACRSMSLSAKIPSAITTRAMVNSQSGASDINKDPNPTLPPKPGPFELIGKSGTSIELVTAAQEYLRTAGISGPKTSTVYPLDFSFTIDGCGGLEFGDAVTTNYMPAIYKTKFHKCAFTVLSVEHNVSGGDWTTTCTTVFRFL